MRILFAAADRDLLRCFQRILESALGETITAFDGAQVLTLTAEETFDAVILERDIPRVDYRHILQRLHSADIPVIVLMNVPVTARLLLGEPLANAYLTYPFPPEALLQSIRDVVFKKSAGGRFVFGDIEADVSLFRIPEGPRLTAPELDILRGLAAGEPVEAARIGAYIDALNSKLIRQNSAARIRYRAGEGYRLVMQNA